MPPAERKGRILTKSCEIGRGQCTNCQTAPLSFWVSQAWRIVELEGAQRKKEHTHKVGWKFHTQQSDKVRQPIDPDNNNNSNNNNSPKIIAIVVVALRRSATTGHFILWQTRRRTLLSSVSALYAPGWLLWVQLWLVLWLGFVVLKDISCERRRRNHVDERSWCFMLWPCCVL